MKKYSKEQNERAKKVKEKLIACGADEELVNKMSRTSRESYLADFEKEEDLLEKEEKIASEELKNKLPRTLGNEPENEHAISKIYPHRVAFKENITEKDKKLVSNQKFIAVIYCKDSYTVTKRDTIYNFLDFFESIFGDETVILIEVRSCIPTAIIDQIKECKISLNIPATASFYAYFGDNFVENDELENEVKISNSLYDRLVSLNLLPGEIYSLNQALEEYAN